MIRASGLFDARWYRRQYPAAHWLLSPIWHYLRRGAQEGCDPNPLFDTRWYLDVNKDVRAAGLNPLAHFVRHGSAEKRNPCSLFDTAWYLSQDPDGRHVSNPLRHFLVRGWQEGRNPHPGFDTRRYLEQHRDVAASGMNPLVHYRLHGRAEGRDVRPVGGAAGGALPHHATRGNTWRIKIISGEPHTPGHSYRVEMLARALEARGHLIRVVAARDLDCGFDDNERPDALVIWRAPFSGQIAQAVATARRGGARIVFDFDDLLIDPSLAQAEIIDGIRSQGMQEAEVAGLYGSFRETLAAADACICPTQELARQARRCQKPSFVLPNGFDERCYEQSRRAVAARKNAAADGLTRIGYAGGTITHQRDFGRAAPALARVLREFPDCRLVLFRDETRADKPPFVDLREFPEFEGLGPCIEWRRSVSLDELPFELARFDVNIAPLETGNVYCEAKSPLKYFEAALVDVPTVASPTAPFVEAVRDGATGFLAEGHEQWYTALRRLIVQPGLRANMGREAFLDVLWRYGPEHRAELASGIFSLIIEAESPAAAQWFELHLRRARAPRRPAPVVPEHDVLFEAGSPALSPVAVVVPLYDYAGHVVEALDSVKAQMVAAKELVVVEDRSSDNSLQVALQWLEANAQHFTRAALLRNRRNEGLALSRNTGIAFTDARFVVPLDADNRMLPNYLRRCLDRIVGSEASAVYATLQEFGDSGGRRSAGPWQPQGLVGGNSIDAMALIRKAAWAAVGGYRHMTVMGWEDYDLWCRFVEDGHWAAWVPETLAEYRVHAESMLATHTGAIENRAVLLDEMHDLHSWLDREALASNSSDTPPVRGAEPVPAGTRAATVQPDRPASREDLVVSGGARCDEHRETRPRNRQRLEAILPLLRCPLTGEGLLLTNDDRLVTVSNSREWALQNWRPVFMQSAGGPQQFPDDHLSNTLPERGIGLIREAAGPVLNVSAGGTGEWLANVVEMEAAIFRNTDVVGDAHHLPFQDGVFEVVLALNAFEHYEHPRRVVDEMLRVLKPGGIVFIHTAFLQPLHEPPWHFYNCTKFGLLKWFAPFETIDVRVSENFNPAYSLAWLADELERAVREHLGDRAAERFARTPVQQLFGYWRNAGSRGDSLWNDLQGLPQEAQERTAAGFEYLGRKTGLRQ